MKRLSAFILMVLIGVVSIITIPVKGFNSDPLTFFESTENMQKLESYRLNQNLVGDFNFDESQQSERGKMTGEYRLKINTDVFNQSPYEADMYSFIRGHIFVDAEGTDRPFDRVNVNIRAEIISLAGDGIYARLNTFNVVADNVPESEKEDYLSFQKELEEKLESVSYIWFYFPMDIIEAANTEGLPAPMQSTLAQENIRENLKEKGLKETYRTMLNDLVERQAMDELEAVTFQNLIDEFFNTDFFTKATVVAGPQKGFTNFTLSKRKISDFIVSVAHAFGEKVTEDDKGELWSMLSKFYLSAMIHEDETNGVFDFFRIKLILKDIDILNQLSVYYSYKVSKINEIDAITMPDEFTSYEVLQLPFLPVRRDDDFCGWGSEADDCLDPGACGSCMDDEWY